MFLGLYKISTEIVNIKTSTYDVYIGRGSIYGNPYKIGIDGNRDDVCNKHLVYLKNNLSSGKFKYKDLKFLDNKRLGCYCAPNKCHGDNYKMLLDEMNKYFKVIVAGSRNYYNKDFIYNKLDILLSKINKPVQIVSGLAKGVDSIAVDYANDRGLSIKTFVANWDEYGKKAGILRNIEMGDYADALIAFRLDNSVGTSHMIDYAKTKNLKIRIYELSSNKTNIFIKINKNISIKNNTDVIINNLVNIIKKYDNISITTNNKKLKDFIESNFYNGKLVVNIIKKVDLTSYDEIIFITVNNSISEYDNYLILEKLRKKYKIINIKINDIKLFDYNLFIKYLNKYINHCNLNNKAVTTNSVYLKFEDTRLGSIRISDHIGILKYGYKWNILTNIQEKKIDNQDNYMRYYYPVTDEILIFKDILKYKDYLNG